MTRGCMYREDELELYYDELKRNVTLENIIKENISKAEECERESDFLQDLARTYRALVDILEEKRSLADQGG